MLLTITYHKQNEHDNATELGYLLYKNPNRPQRFELSYGYAYVFYPCVSNEKTQVALLLDIDPIDLARGKTGSNTGGLFDYVNDRPYVSSSFLSNAISKVFGTAMSGRADDRQAIADSPLDLEANITMLPCRGELEMLNKVFEPLGYSVNFDSFELDDKFPSWGSSKYVNLNIRGKVRLRDLLRHIYILVPVFDRQKHYWVGEDEIQKLLLHAEDWLIDHPEKAYITRRYLKHQKTLVNKAFVQLVSADESGDDLEKSATEEDGKPSEVSEKKLSLNDKRLGSVVAALKSNNVKTVIDIGCGEGNLLRLLLKEKQFARIAGTDVSYSALEKAKQKLKLKNADDGREDRIKLFQSSITYKDSRFTGYDAVCVIEVIEHLDIPRLAAFERVLFEYAKPQNIIITTPNRDYNAKYDNVGENNLRHSDHRFEWSREEFHAWAERTASQYGYTVKFSEIGEKDEEFGASTQMGVFTQCG